MVRNNISFDSRIKSYKNFLRKYIEFFFLFRKKYRNYLRVILRVLRRQYPINAVLKTGERIIFYSYEELYGNLRDLDCDFKNNLVYVDGLKFYGGVSNADSIISFIQRQYDFLPVKDRVVIDIGANIGDSPIYFALKGAKRVIGIEPDPQVYDFANKNIELNGFSDRIELIRSSVSNKGTNIKDLNKRSLITLKGIIEKYKMIPSILKMDCEGCEYDVILSASCSTLVNFTHIQIEYHHGYENLKKKLEACGFRVKVTEPSYFNSPFCNSSINRLVSADGNVTRINKTYSGMLYASRA